MTINAYLVDVVTILIDAGIDDWGEPLSGSEVCVPAYISYKTRLVTTITGEKALSSAMIYLPHWIEDSGYLVRALSHKDRIKFDNIEHVILKIDEPKHFSDPHYEVYIV